ncbi:NUDIX domain-containing protein [Kitasatospora azatica]|uniref:NUDIX domain-containing protein n=1 Tax=Kitasatospora azatica TaxID=58347 RepID=UPI00055BDB0E|nr:NUDIX domain-containing protein [Kitasatospora azatica]
MSAPAEQWTVHGSRNLYTSPWVGLDLVTVRPPGHDAYDHHVVRLPAAVGVVLHDPDRGVLLLHRHRFITDTSGYEIPAGGVEAGESVEAAAAREAHEETGWRTGPVSRLLTCNASDGATDQRFHLVHARATEYTGPPADAYEASSLSWVPATEIPGLIRQGLVPGTLSTVALLFALQFNFI